MAPNLPSPFGGTDYGGTTYGTFLRLNGKNTNGSPAMAPLGTSSPVSAVTGNVPGVSDASGSTSLLGDLFTKEGGGLDTGNLKVAMGGIQAVGNLWNSYQQSKLAKEQMKFSKDAFATNLGIQKKTYNTALTDRIKARHRTEGKSSAQTNAYLKENRI